MEENEPGEPRGNRILSLRFGQWLAFLMGVVAAANYFAPQHLSFPALGILAVYYAGFLFLGA